MYFALKKRADMKVHTVPWYLGIRVELVIQESSDRALQSMEPEMLCYMQDPTRYTIHYTNHMSIA